MSGTIRNVFFILKDIEIRDIFQRFSVFLKIESYDFLKMGDFVKADLPNGLNFPVLLEESWFEKPEIEVEIRTNGLIYAGIFEFDEPARNLNLSISGTATVYNTRNLAENISLECTILVESPLIEVQEEEVERKIMVTRETQTEKEKRKSVKNGETQTIPSPPPTPPPPIVTSDASTITDEPHLSLEDLQPILTSSIAKHLKEHRHHSLEPKKTPKEDFIEDPKPSKPGASGLHSNTYNLMPRISKLKDLDAIIKQKEDQLAMLNTEIEMKRKLKKVIEMREVLKEQKVQKGAKDTTEPKNKKDPEELKNPVEKPIKNPEEAKQDPKIDPKPKDHECEGTTGSSSTSRSSLSEISESTSTSSSSDSTETSSSSSSEETSSSSPPSSAETVKAAPPATVAAQHRQVVNRNKVPERSDGESTIEDPFSSRQDSFPDVVPEVDAPPPPESPTTAYLNQMRANMMNTMQKRYL